MGCCLTYFMKMFCQDVSGAESINTNPDNSSSNLGVASACIPPVECATRMTLSKAFTASTSATDQCEKYSLLFVVILEPSPGKSRCHIVPGSCSIFVSSLNDSEPKPGPPGRNNQ